MTTALLDNLTPDQAWDLFVSAQHGQSVAFRMEYVDMTGDFIAGLMLSQIIYWNSPSKKTGKDDKLSVVRGDRRWLAISAEDWYEQCRLTPKQVVRGLDVLCGHTTTTTKDDQGVEHSLKVKGDPASAFIEVRVMRFGGVPTRHVWVNKPYTIRRWRDLLAPPKEEDAPKVPKGNNRKCRKDKSESAERDVFLTYTSANTSTNDTSELVNSEGKESVIPLLLAAEPAEMKPPVKQQRVRKEPKSPDPRSFLPAILAVLEVTGRRPPIETYDLVIKALGDDPDIPQLKRLWANWRIHGRNPTNIEDGLLVDYRRPKAPEEVPKVVPAGTWKPGDYIIMPSGGSDGRETH